MSRVLVTGANGFVGSNLVEMLQQRGDDVTCLVRQSPRNERLRALSARLTLFEGFSDRQAVGRAVEGQEIVYHVAGATKALSAARFWEVNEEGTRSVAEACAECSQPPTLLHVSSLAACGPSTPPEPRRESDPPMPVSDYGRSKLAGERMVRRTAGRVPTTIVRPAIVLGPADMDGLAMFRSVRRFRVHVTPGSGRQEFSIIHVTDLCRLMILAAERGKRISTEETDASRAAGCYFAAAEEHPSWAELGRMVARALGRRGVLVVPAPKPCIWGVAAVVQTASRVVRKPLYLNWDKAHEITAGSWVCSPETAMNELDFAFDVSLEQRLEQTATWYREAGWL